MFLFGADENGMGPRLGPLIVTGVLLELPEAYDRAALRRRGLSAGIGDSKNTSAFGKMAHAESLALGLITRTTGATPGDHDELLAALCLGGALALREPCPDAGAARAQCWQPPLPLPAFGGHAAAGDEMLERFERSGIRFHRVRSRVVCAGVLNAELAAGFNKLRVDLASFERLFLDAQRAARAEVTAICGMVGGMRKYGGYFRHVDADSAERVEETRKRCAYRFEGKGELAFEVGADDRHFPVSLASMVGKYIRELAMARLHAFYDGQLDALPKASGYHDTVTTRFIDGTAELRRRLEVVDDCFRRRR